MKWRTSLSVTGAFVLVAIGGVGGWAWARYAAKPGADDRFEERRKAIAKTLMSFSDIPIAVGRANVLAAASDMQSARFKRSSEPRMLCAAISTAPEWARKQWKVLSCLVVAPARERANMVMFYIDSNGRSVEVLWEATAPPGEDLLQGFAEPVSLVDAEELAKKGTTDAKGVVRVRLSESYSVHEPLPVPDTEVAIAYRYPDGHYTNFVPLARLDKSRVRLFSRELPEKFGGEAPVTDAE